MPPVLSLRMTLEVIERVTPWQRRGPERASSLIHPKSTPSVLVLTLPCGAEELYDHSDHDYQHDPEPSSLGLPRAAHRRRLAHIPARRSHARESGTQDRPCRDPGHSL